MAKEDRYGENVFINCPFDAGYRGMFHAVVFTVMDCGFRPRCALEAVDSGQVRLDKIVAIIRESRFGVHDLSRTELDDENRLPRFNMPFELGLFLAAQRFGSGKQKAKVSLILDREQFRYQKFLSDIAGQDIRSHYDDSHKAIAAVRDWLRPHVVGRPLPGGDRLGRRYDDFFLDLPRLCSDLRLNVIDIAFTDYIGLVELWLGENP